MAIRFEWEDRYSVGNEVIDNQHKRFLALADSLPDVLDRERIGKIIMDMYRHIREHFSSEESLMSDSGYPKLVEHVRLHNELIGKLNAISVQELKDDKAAYELKKLIYEWALDHILTHDLDFFRFFNDNSGGEGR